jgi:hypothetical protein
MWRLVGVIIAAIVVLSILGAVLRALRWMLYIALALAVLSVILGWIAKDREGTP